MSSPADWIRGYARQADADLKSFHAVQRNLAVSECHRLLLLQMACEKLCKAHLIATGTSRIKLQASHAYIAKPLPVIIGQHVAFLRRDAGQMRSLLTATRHLAQEIELLSPSVDRGGQRPDNCEYPWEDHGGVLHSPLTWTFDPSRLLTEPSGPAFLKLVRVAINRLLQ